MEMTVKVNGQVTTINLENRSIAVVCKEFQLTVPQIKILFKEYNKNIEVMFGEDLKVEYSEIPVKLIERINNIFELTYGKRV